MLKFSHNDRSGYILIKQAIYDVSKSHGVLNSAKQIAFQTNIGMMTIIYYFFLIISYNLLIIVVNAGAKSKAKAKKHMHSIMSLLSLPYIKDCADPEEAITET